MNVKTLITELLDFDMDDEILILDNRSIYRRIGELSKDRITENVCIHFKQRGKILKDEINL